MNRKPTTSTTSAWARLPREGNEANVNPTAWRPARTSWRKAVALTLAFALAFTMWDTRLVRPAFADDGNAPDQAAEVATPNSISADDADDSDNEAAAASTTPEDADAQTGLVAGDTTPTPPATEQETPDVRAGPATTCVITFYDSADAAARILNRQWVSIPQGQSVAFDVSGIEASPATSTEAFAGWAHQGRVHADVITIDWTQTAVDLRPSFTSGHWLRFDSNCPDGEATYLPSRFVGANASSLNSLPVPARAGYAFAGWHAGDPAASSAGPLGQVSDASGVLIAEASLIERLRQSDVTLYAQWEPARTTFRVFTWLQNPDDDGYSYEGSYVYGDDDGEEVFTGESTADESIAYAEHEGFTFKSADAETAAGDGSTTVDVYYDRNTYHVYFHSDRTDSATTVIDGLTISARYGADIHDLWPALREDGAGYPTTWYTLPDENSRVFVAGLDTMPLGDTHLYWMEGGDTGYVSVYHTQDLDDPASFTQYVAAPFNADNSPSTTADDYMAIKGFAVNAASESDAAEIRANQTGDSGAVHDPNQPASCAIGAKFDDATAVTWADGEQRHPLHFYYLRLQYDVVFEENGGPLVENATDIYYEAPLVGAAPTEYVVGQTAKTEQNGATYLFAGWYDNPDFAGDPFDFANETMDAANMVLYAKWVPTGYLVQLDPNGGAFVDDDQSSYFWVEHGQAVGPVAVERDYIMDPAGEYRYDFSTYEGEVAGGGADGFGEALYAAAVGDDGGTRYRYEDDAYQLFGWYEVVDGQLDSEPYDFSEPVTGNVLLRALWNSTTTVDVAYNPTMVRDGTTVTGDIDTPLDPGYSEGSQTFVMNVPANVTATDDGTWEFVCWQLVSDFGEEPAWADEAVYLPGDVFTVDLSMAADGTIHFQAVYERAAESSGAHDEGSTAESESKSEPENKAEEKDGGTALSESAKQQSAPIAALPKTGDVGLIPMLVLTILASVGAGAIAGYLYWAHRRSRLDESA